MMGFLRRSMNLNSAERGLGDLYIFSALCWKLTFFFHIASWVSRMCDLFFWGKGGM